MKRLFQNDLSGTIAKYDIIQNAKLYRDHIAIAVVDHTVGRVTAAQAADELLNIVGISTSFVLFPDGEQIIISGRSMGDSNVQVILEQLGGGGNAAAAGGQVAGKTLEQVEIPQGMLIIMVQRGEQTIIPRGDTLIEEGDMLVAAQF